MKRKNLNRREFLKRAGIVTGGAMAMMALDPFTSFAKSKDNDEASAKPDDLPHSAWHRRANLAAGLWHDAPATRQSGAGKSAR